MALTVLEKRPDAKLAFSIDFASLMPSGVSLSGTPSVSQTNKGFVTSSNNVTLGTPSIVSEGVDFTCDGGTDGEIYVLTCSCDGDNGEEYVGEGVLLVREVV